MIKRGKVLKKQTTMSHMIPINLFRASVPSEAFIFVPDLTINERIFPNSNDVISKSTHNIPGIWSQCDGGAFGMLSSQKIRNNMCVGNGSHGGKPVVLGLALIYFVTVRFDGSLCALQLGPAVSGMGWVRSFTKRTRDVRIEFNGVLLDTTTSEESTNGDGRPFFCYLPALQVSHQNGLEFSHGVVVKLDQFREPSDTPADVDRSRGVGHLNGLEDILYSMI